jgi:hypothetical protein
MWANSLQALVRVSAESPVTESASLLRQGKGLLPQGSTEEPGETTFPIFRRERESLPSVRILLRQRMAACLLAEGS